MCGALTLLSPYSFVACKGIPVTLFPLPIIIRTEIAQLEQCLDNGLEKRRTFFQFAAGARVFLLPKVPLPVLATGTYLIFPDESFLQWKIG